VRAPVVAAVAVAVLASACGSAGTGPETGDESSDAAAASSTSTTNPLTFASTTTEGEDFDARDLAGRDVVLWFWAPWCTVCRSEAPQVAAAAEQVEDVTVIGVASSGSLQEMREFVDETGAGTLTHVADVPGDVWRSFEVVAQPTFVFIDDDGRTQTFAGGLPQAALVDAMKQLAQA
jgi:thiol-disulfide isomerase/thioredoxin